MKLQCQRMTSPKGSFNKMAACVLTWERVRERARKGGGEKKNEEKKEGKKKKTWVPQPLTCFVIIPFSFSFLEGKRFCGIRDHCSQGVQKGFWAAAGVLLEKKFYSKEASEGSVFFRIQHIIFFFPVNVWTCRRILYFSSPQRSEYTSG